MYIVKKNDVVHKIYGGLVALGPMIFTAIIFILEMPMPLKSIIIYLGLLLIEMLIGVIVYIVIRLFTKKYYIFDKEKIVEYKKDNIINVIDLKAINITRIYSTGDIGLLPFPVGVGYLVIEYINNNNSKERVLILLRLKNVKIISKVIRIRIEIR